MLTRMLRPGRIGSIATLTVVLTIAACGGGDDGTARTPTTQGTDPDPTDDADASGGAGADDPNNDGDGCTPVDECRIDEDCDAGETCLPTCTCFDDDDDEGASCADDEVCAATPVGNVCLGFIGCGIVCDPLLAPDAVCPDGMICGAATGLCGYDLGDLPQAGDPTYPLPTEAGCPAGTREIVAAGSATAPDAIVCAPTCTDAMEACPEPDTGDALFTSCLPAQDSSQQPCSP